MRYGLTVASLNAVNAGNILKKAVESFNAGHLADARKRKNPEFKLVEHVKGKLSKNPNIGKVLKNFKNVYKKYGKITFLYQPEIDLLFRYDGFLHGVEFKLLGNSSVFYNGVEEALAQSTYGIDFSWIVQFYRMGYENSSNYRKWMQYTIERSKCPSVGYIAATTKSCKIHICPTKPFSRSQADRELKEAVSATRKDLIRKIGNR